MRSLAVILAALTLSGAAIAASIGPTSIRRATVADLSPKRPKVEERWLVQALDPTTRRSIAVEFEQAHGALGARAMIYNAGFGESAKESAGRVTSLSSRSGGGVTTNRGGIWRDSQGWTVRLAGSDISVAVTVRGARPGVTTGPWRFGTDAFYGPQDVTSSTPVARGKASGIVRVGTESLTLRNWNVVIQHTWQSLEYVTRGWFYTDRVVIFTPDATWLLQGWAPELPAAEATKNDVFGRTWRGVLARVTDSGATWCRPTVRRGRLWSGYDAFGWVHPGTISARCGSLSLELTGLKPGPTLDRLTSGYSSRSFVGRAGGGIGLQAHLARKPGG